MKVAAIILILFAVRACKTEEDKNRALEISRRDYFKTEDGIRYFATCIEGFKFIATHAGYGTTLAGPTGKCARGRQ